jgi:hypothetical protein
MIVLGMTFLELQAEPLHASSQRRGSDCHADFK